MTSQVVTLIHRADDTGSFCHAIAFNYLAAKAPTCRYLVFRRVRAESYLPY